MLKVIRLVTPRRKNFLYSSPFRCLALYTWIKNKSAGAPQNLIYYLYPQQIVIAQLIPLFGFRLNLYTKTKQVHLPDNGCRQGQFNFFFRRPKLGVSAVPIWSDDLTNSNVMVNTFSIKCVPFYISKVTHYVLVNNVLQGKIKLFLKSTILEITREFLCWRPLS